MDIERIQTIERDDFQVLIIGDHYDFSASVIHLPSIDSPKVQLRHFLLVGSFCYRGDVNHRLGFINIPVFDVCGAITLKSPQGATSSNGMKVLKEILEANMLSSIFLECSED